MEPSRIVDLPRKGRAFGLSDITTFDAEESVAFGATIASEPVKRVNMSWTSVKKVSGRFGLVMPWMSADSPTRR